MISPSTFPKKKVFRKVEKRDMKDALKRRTYA